MRCFTLVFFDDQNMEKLPLSYSLRAEEGTMSCWYAFSSSLPASLCLCITSLFLSFPIAFTHSLCFTVLLVRSPMYLWSTGIYFFYKRTRASSRPAFRTHAVKRRWKLKTINCRLNCVTSCHGVSLQHCLYVHMFTYIFKGHQPHLTHAFYYFHPKGVIILFILNLLLFTRDIGVKTCMSVPQMHHDFRDTPLLHLVCCNFEPEYSSVILQHSSSV